MMDKQAFLSDLRVEVRTLEFWLEQEWILPARGTDELHFSETDLARARFIRDLKSSLGVNDEGVDVILHLVDQLHGFRRAFEDLHADLKGKRGP